MTSNFEDGLIDEKTAKEQLRKLDLSRLDNFGTSYVASINKIMSSVVENDAVVCDDCIVNTDENENVVDNKENIENKLELIKYYYILIFIEIKFFYFNETNLTSIT